MIRQIASAPLTTSKPRSRPTRSSVALAAVLTAALLGAGCKKKDSSSEATATQGQSQAIQNIGSDTMVNLAQAWAEAYSKVNPKVSVEVSGGGSGVGIAALINGTADVANASRQLEPSERDKAAKQGGAAPTEHVVGFDGLAIFVHKDNPLEQISIAELSEIYREGGKLEKWTALGVGSIPGAQGDEIVRISRQNNSGTYHYFRENVVGKNNDFKPGSLDMNGSKDVVELVGRTPNSIGYSGVGYATAAVKVLKVSKSKGEPGVAPSNATILDKTYPIARPMFMYVPNDAPAHVKDYLAWILTPAGQKVVEETGYVPLPKK